ncbi:sugar ABC transporter substrate-binding protein [Streptomyces kasugaensis]|uniref:Sugar ABC transporter substrate-binding protein n=1 Tax=Streptomyces kasugaensis TaxID=1946 RepID=A0A4Q9I3D8_STRKA|nr:substrate-binding domain-containing protein [Streptomyces kasugaensis]TBO61479.1 sugar ABC transporter substrate-binding protein [Streptomyces kasugaensis]
MICVRTARPGFRGAAALLAALALVAGCSGSGGEHGGHGGTGAGRRIADTPRMTFAMVSHADTGDTFWNIVRNGAEQAAAKDNVKFLYANDTDGAEQAEAVESYIDQKVDGLIVTLAEPAAVEAAVRKAVARGIPVITVNAGGRFSRAYGALTHIGQDEAAAGREVGAELTARHAKKALCVIHEQGDTSLADRCAGVRKGFHGPVANLTVDGADASAARSAVAAALRADRSIDAVVTLGAPMAALTAEARKQAGSTAQLATFDLDATVVRLLKSKDLAFAVDQQPYLQGYEAVDLLWLDKVNGNVLGGGRPVLTGPTLVTSKDVPKLAEYTGRGTR